ncbi:MAG: OmpA family protein [Spirochaetes bacterium]|nr:OmpA family protein [Spirochaetota bacterium]
MRKVVFILINCFVSFYFFGIFRIPEAGRYYYWLMSPELLGKGMGTGGTESPSGIVINPASNAFVQRIKVEASYGIAPGFWSRNGLQHISDYFLPFIINTGFIIPSKYGNFSFFTNYSNMSNYNFKKEFKLLYGNNNELNYGKTGVLFFNYSKDYMEKFAFGFNGNFKISYNPASKYPENKFDASGAVDIGFLFKPEWYFPFSKKSSSNWAWQNFEMALSIKDIGKPLINSEDGPNGDRDIYWFAQPFTPSIGFRVDPYNDGATYWRLMADFTAPFFQNLTIACGMELQIYKFLVLRGSYTFDLEGVLEYSRAISQYENLYNIANASFGISFKFTSDFFKKQTKEEMLINKHKTTSFSIDLGAKPYSEGFILLTGCTITFGVKDKSPPEISYNQRNSYISPNLDGVQDELILDIDIKDERYIVLWKFEIYDENNNIVRTIEGKKPRRESQKFKDIVKEYFSPKSGIPVPKQLIWDGRDNNGNLVKDGEYTFKLFAMDDNKNMNIEGTVKGIVNVDTEKPEIKSKITNDIFSPNNDGSKDKLIIDIDIIKQKINGIMIMVKNGNTDKMDTVKNEELDKKQLWYIDIVDTKENVVRTYVFNEKGKKSIEWDGNDNDGNKVPDGIYKIKLYSTDLAGNYWEQIISNIVIDTEAKPIEALILNKYFSPNNDKIRDDAEFQFNIPVVSGIEKWKLEILDKKNNTVKIFDGLGKPELKMKWDGKTDQNETAKEDEYNAKLTVFYINGNKSESTTPGFILDITPPKCGVDIDKSIFNPNGDGKSDTVKIVHDATEENEWQGTIIDSQSRKVKSYVWKNQPPVSFAWDGKSDSNKLLNDGKYYYYVSSTDDAGNSFMSEKKELSIFTQDIPVFISASYESISPNNDGILDYQIFEIKTKLNELNKISSWSILIYDENDKRIFSYYKPGNVVSKYDWNGKMNDNKNAKDGYYYAKLVVNFEAGNISESKTGLFTVDTIPPAIQVMTLSKVFSPNNDGNLDSLEILQKGSDEDIWEAAITDNKNKIIWQKFYSGEPVKKEQWNGRDKSGNILKNGLYNYRITSIDKAGNKGEAEITDIELKNIFTSAYILLDTDKFSPNNDRIKDNIRLKPVVSYKENINGYKIEIFNKNNKLIKLYQGKISIPEFIDWDGISNENKRAEDGIYKAVFSLIYDFGNKPVVESNNFILDTTPPQVSLKFSNEFFSPDDDGVDDNLTIFIDSYDLTGIKDWKISILEPNYKDFKTFAGEGNITSKIVWDGKSNEGELVESAEDYPVKIFAEDLVGNIKEITTGPIMIDILVIKLPDGRLKIKISNIEFKPDSAEMTESPKNLKIINLLSRALNKYKFYNITVEGHANRYREDLNEAVAKTLSEERAKTVAFMLNKKGVKINRMIIIGRGFDQPLFPLKKDADQEKLAKNRRVEFYLDKK